MYTESGETGAAEECGTLSTEAVAPDWAWPRPTASKLTKTANKEKRNDCIIIIETNHVENKESNALKSAMVSNEIKVQADFDKLSFQQNLNIPLSQRTLAPRKVKQA